MLYFECKWLGESCLLDQLIDTGCKFNVYKTFRRRLGYLLNVLCQFDLRPVPVGKGNEQRNYSNEHTKRCIQTSAKKLMTELLL